MSIYTRQIGRKIDGRELERIKKGEEKDWFGVSTFKPNYTYFTLCSPYFPVLSFAHSNFFLLYETIQKDLKI